MKRSRKQKKIVGLLCVVVGEAIALFAGYENFFPHNLIIETIRIFIILGAIALVIYGVDIMP